MAGQPLAYKTLDELDSAVDSYFHKADPEREGDSSGDAWVDSGDGVSMFMPTMSGLAMALGVDRRTITNYAHNEEYFPTIKRARSIVEQALERRLYMGNPAGVIFNLKNNFSWTDKTQNEITGANGGAIESKWTVEFVNAEAK